MIDDSYFGKYIIGRVQHANDFTYKFREEFADRNHNLCYGNLENIFP